MLQATRLRSNHQSCTFLHAKTLKEPAKSMFCFVSKQRITSVADWHQTASARHIYQQAFKAEIWASKFLFLKGDT